MPGETVTTGVDDLIEYCKGKEKVALQDAAKVLSIPVETVQAWVDFLVEEKILGIEYRFTKPYIYLNKETGKHTTVVEQSQHTLDDIKATWIAHARTQKIPEDKLAELWRGHLQSALDRQKEYFMEQATQRHAKKPGELWRAYSTRFMERSA